METTAAVAEMTNGAGVEHVPTTAERARKPSTSYQARVFKIVLLAVVVTSMISVLNINLSIVSSNSWCIFGAYILMVAISPLWCRYIKPITPYPLLASYNILCIVLSAISAVGFTYSLLVDCRSVFSIARCNSPVINFSFQLYHYTKIIELLDTLWMMIRHRSRQISALHVFHHSTMLLLSDYAYRMIWPALSIPLLMNSYIHIALYYYYLITLNAKASPSWKRRLTEAQILQFAVGILHASIGYVQHGFCPYSILYGVSLLLLFSQFYYNAYLKPRKSSTTDQTKKLD